MTDTVKVLGREFEYGFLVAWIKYNRIKKGYSQSALAHGICSVSHLSYFENSKTKLRNEIIEALLKKLNLSISIECEDILHIRKELYNLFVQIESYNYKEASIIYDNLLKFEEIIMISPYSIEFKIYQLAYSSFVLNLNYNDLKEEISSLDSVYTSLNDDLQHLYMFISGKIIYKSLDHHQGIDRLEKAHSLKETSWVNHSLGFSYHYNNEPLKGVHYLEKALEGYEKNGRYINAIWCQNHLGNGYTSLKLYKKAEHHFKAALTSAKYFNLHIMFDVIYNNLSKLYFSMNIYDKSIYYSKLSLEISEDPILPVYNLINSYVKLDKINSCKTLFDTYLIDEYKNSHYYYLLYFSYLSLFHLEENVFYKEVTEKILPFYYNLGYLSHCKTIKYKLAEHLERKRRYKEANKIYKELLN